MLSNILFGYLCRWFAQFAANDYFCGMSDSSIIKWLKKLFTINGLALLLTLIGTIVAINECQRNRGGALRVEYNGGEVRAGDNFNMLLVAADSVVPVNEYAVWPLFSNPSSHAVKDLQLQYFVTSDGMLLRPQPMWVANGTPENAVYRYSEPAVYANSTADVPFSSLQLFKNNAGFTAKARATHEGLKEPISITVNGNVLLLKRAQGESFESWIIRARKYITDNGIKTPDIYCFLDKSNHKVESAIEEDPGSETDRKPVKEEISGIEPEAKHARDSEPEESRQSQTKAGTAATDCDGAPVITGLENLKVEFAGTYDEPKAVLRFDAPGRPGLVMIMTKGLQGPGEANLFRRLLIGPAKFQPKASTCLAAVSGNQTELEIPLRAKLSGYKFPGLLTPDSLLSGDVERKGNTFINRGKKPLLLSVYGNVKEAGGIPGTKIASYYLTPGASADLQAEFDKWTDVRFTYYKAPYLENYVQRTTWVRISIWSLLIVAAFIIWFAISLELDEKWGVNENLAMVIGLAIGVIFLAATGCLIFAW